MIEIKAYKIGIALYFYSRYYTIKHNIHFIPSFMAMSMAVFLLKHPKLLQTPQYKHLYDELLEFQLEDNYLTLRKWNKNLGNNLDRDDLRNIAKMINDIEMQDEDSKIYELELSDIDEFIADYLY